MQYQSALDLRSAHAVTGDIDHIVDAAGDPVVAVLVAATAVTSEIIAFVLLEVGGFEALVIAVDGAHLAGPGGADRQYAGDIVALDLGALLGFE